MPHGGQTLSLGSANGARMEEHVYGPSFSLPLRSPTAVTPTYVRPDFLPYSWYIIPTSHANRHSEPLSLWQEWDNSPDRDKLLLLTPLFFHRGQGISSPLHNEKNCGGDSSEPPLLWSGSNRSMPGQPPFLFSPSCLSEQTHLHAHGTLCVCFHACWVWLGWPWSAQRAEESRGRGLSGGTSRSCHIL